MQPLISVIVPMYNAQKYIDRCLTSLIRQTLNNIQILLVNDGSTDETEKIAKEYEDKRIIVISINRSGPGVARNIGIDKAEGEYIAFVDVDDWIEEDALEKLYLSAKNSDADIAVCGFIREVIDVQGNTYSIEVYPFKDNN